MGQNTLKGTTAGYFCQVEGGEQEPLGRAEEAEGKRDGGHEDAETAGHGGGGDKTGE